MRAPLLWLGRLVWRLGVWLCRVADDTEPFKDAEILAILAWGPDIAPVVGEIDLTKPPGHRLRATFMAEAACNRARRFYQRVEHIQKQNIAKGE